jgi:hypothetical protein
VVGVDALFLRSLFWERLRVNIGIVLVFAAFYLRFLKRPRPRPDDGPICPPGVQGRLPAVTRGAWQIIGQNASASTTAWAKACGAS